MTKETFVNALRAAGMDDSKLKRFHQELERNHPKEHAQLLEWLGIEDAERMKIREASRK